MQLISNFNFIEISSWHSMDFNWCFIEISTCIHLNDNWISIGILLFFLFNLKCLLNFQFPISNFQLNFKWILTRFPMDFHLNFIKNFNLISNWFPLVFHCNFNLFFIAILTQFPMDFILIYISISLKFLLEYHWNFKRIFNWSHWYFI